MNKTEETEKRIVFRRNEDGLLDNVDYKFDEFGFIDWKSMIPKEYVYPNKNWFIKHNKAIPDSVEGLTEDQLVVSLKGLKWALKIRGYTSVDTSVVKNEDGSVSANCSICFIPNFETRYSSPYNDEAVTYSDCGNASSENTVNIYNKFLEPIAVNRAFCRCVRNFLNIHSVSDEELDTNFLMESDQPPSESKPNFTKPQEVLENLAKEKKYEDFESFKADFKNLGYFHKKADQWVEYSNLPAKEARILISKLNKK